MQFRKNAIRPVRCFVEGWKLVKDQYPLFVLLCFFCLLIGGAIPLGLVLGASFCSIYAMVLKKMDGGQIGFDGLLKGFYFFKPSLVVTMFLVVPTILLAVPMMSSAVSLMYALVPTKGGVDENQVYALFTTFSIFAVLFTLISGTIHAFVLFAYPLIVEHRLTGVAAFKISSRAVLANANGVIGIIVGEFVLSLIGLAFFGIGIYLVVPLMFAAVTVAYRQVFPAAEVVNSN